MEPTSDIPDIKAELDYIKARLTVLQPVAKDDAVYSKKIEHIFERIVVVEMRHGITGKRAA